MSREGVDRFVNLIEQRPWLCLSYQSGGRHPQGTKMAIGARHRSAIGLACGLLAAGASGSAEDLRPVPHHGSADHLGVASCASAACHGAVTPAQGGTVLQNEYTTWQTDDAHAKAYNLLFDERSAADRPQARARSSAHGQGLSRLSCRQRGRGAARARVPAHRRRRLRGLPRRRGGLDPAAYRQRPSDARISATSPPVCTRPPIR